MQNMDFNHMILSWSLFCKELLPQRNFSFWEWFYAVMKLTKEHLKGPWTDGYYSKISKTLYQTYFH